MLNFRLGKIVSYIGKSGADVEKAANDFFNGVEVGPDLPNIEQISSLFNEWLIFDYKLSTGVTISTDYYLKNPDNLSEILMDELKQIIGTQTYQLFELEDSIPGEYVIVYSLFSGKKYKVIEKTFSREIVGRKGSFFNRVANVNGDYYFIGSNPSFLPITYTDRSRKFYLQTDKTVLTPKDALGLLVPKKENEKVNKDEKYLQMKNGIRTKRRKLEKEFSTLKKKSKVNVSFDKLVAFVYKEAYKDHFADFYKDIMRIGIPEKMVFDEYKFFQDLWNFFPHKILGNKCPADLYKEVYGKNKADSEVFCPVNSHRQKQIDEFVDSNHEVMAIYYDLLEKNLPETKLKKELEILIKKDPDFYDSYFELAMILSGEGEYEKGTELLKIAFQKAILKIVDKDGNFPKLLRWGYLENRHIIRAIDTWALELWGNGDKEKALDLLRKLLRSNHHDNIGARYSILAIRLGLNPDYEQQFVTKGMLGYLDAIKISDWFEENSKKFPDEFGWWLEAIKKEEN